MKLTVSKMNYQSTLVFCLQIVLIHTAPLHMPLLQMQPLFQPMEQLQPMELMQQPMSMELMHQPMPMELMHQPMPMELMHQPMQMESQQLMPLSQQASLQQQLLAMQQMQALQQMNTVHLPSTLFLPQPLLIILPDPQNELTETTNDKFKKNDDDSKGNDVKNNEKEYVDEDLDAVIVEAAESTEHKVPNDIPNRQMLQKAIVLLPNGRFSLGEIITAIPWLPFEINVPDTIAWAYNGISNGIAGIISIIGQRLPFRRPHREKFLSKLLMNHEKQKDPMTILVVPLPINGMVLPVRQMIPGNDMLTNRMPLDRFE